MRARVSDQWSMAGLFGTVILPLTAICLLACSVPNLAPSECVEARDVIREFYSLHFGSDMAFSAESLERKKEYLTPAFYQRLKSDQVRVDPFTRTEDLPKAFRVGDCKVTRPENRVTFDVLLFWKTDTRTEQRSIPVEAAKVEDRWLIDNVD